MKTAKKRALAFLMAVLVVMTTVFGNVDYSAKAEETTKATWSKVELSDITAEDTIMITMTCSDGAAYALSTTEKNSSGGPLAKSVTIANNTIVTDTSAEFALNVTSVEGGYHIMSGESYLYVTATNNGVRIGNPELKASAVWSVSSNYLSAVDSKNTARYLGVYNKSDWRCYTNTTGNTAGQTLGFWKLGESTTPSEPDTPVVETCAAVTASVTAGDVEAGTKVELACSTEGATILYNTDGTTNYSTYTEAITINETTTISARATKDSSDGGVIYGCV